MAKRDDSTNEPRPGQEVPTATPMRTEGPPTPVEVAKKFAPKGHKEPVHFQSESMRRPVQVWEPEAYNALLAERQRKRGEAVNVPEFNLGRLHKHTAQPIVQQDPPRPGARQNVPMPGGDAQIGELPPELQ